MPTIEKVNSAKNIRASIRYARDSKDKRGYPKLHDKIGINCNPENAEDDFEATNFVNNWSNRKHVQLKKFVLGFGPLNKDTLSAKEAHIYAKNLLTKYNEKLGGGWRIAAYAHHDHPQSYHYHVLIDNCNLKTGQKFTSIYQDVEKLRALNDQVSKSFGIKPIQKSRLVAKGMNETKGQEKAQKNNHTRYAYQDHVRVLMSKAMLKSSNFSEFKQVLNYNNAYLKSNFINKKSKVGTIIIPSIQPNGNYNHNKNGNRTKRKVRTGKLGLAFDKSNILEQLSKPISQRSDKYMSIYQKYSKTPNSVILKNIASTPFMGNDDNKEKTSSKYLSTPVVKNRFKTKGEINLERQFKLIGTIKELNAKFSEEKSVSKGSERLPMEVNPEGDRQEQQLSRAKRAVEKPIQPIQPRTNKSVEESVGRAKRAVDRAKQQTRAISTSSRRKSEAPSASPGQIRPAQSNSKRKRQTSPGQRAITLTYQHFGVKTYDQEQHQTDCREHLSKRGKAQFDATSRQINGHYAFIQRCRENLKKFEHVRWRELRKKLGKVRKFFKSFETVTKSVQSTAKNATRNIQSKFGFRLSEGRNQLRQGSNSQVKESTQTSSKLNQFTQLKQVLRKLKSLNSKDRITLDNTDNDNIKLGNKVDSASKKLRNIYNEEDKKFQQEKENYEKTHSDTYSEHLDKSIAKQKQHKHSHSLTHRHQI